MKKLLFLFFAMFLISVSVKGQQATTQQRLADGNVVVKYYNDVLNGGKDGFLIIDNHSSYTIDHLHIRVTVKVTSYENNIKQEKTLVLCDDNITDIPASQTLTVSRTNRGVIKGGPEKDGKTYVYNIEIN